MPLRSVDTNTHMPIHKDVSLYIYIHIKKSFKFVCVCEFHTQQLQAHKAPAQVIFASILVCTHAYLPLFLLTLFTVLLSIYILLDFDITAFMQSVVCGLHIFLHFANCIRKGRGSGSYEELKRG